MLFTRPDGTLVKKISPLRQVMPHVIPTRNGAAIYYELDLRLDEALPWLEAQREQTGYPLTLFHLLLYGLATTYHQHPELHRFVASGRLWQRDRCELSFAVKKRLEAKAPMTAVKVFFPEGASLLEVAKMSDAGIGVGRGEKKTTSEREMAVTSKLPWFVMSWLLGVQRVLDRWNLLPGSLLAPDPLYASAFVANLGSIGLDAPWHHLYEYGTVSLFAVLGKVRDEVIVGPEGTPVCAKVARLRVTLDERVADGLTWARGLETLRAILESPATSLDQSRSSTSEGLGRGEGDEGAVSARVTP
jgi:hypothetical protein